jgi:hydrogenase maturation protease
MKQLKDIPCLVLGIGNILWADEGFGVRAAERFHAGWALTDPNSQVCDGGTLGMYLFDRICRTKDLLLFDCCDFQGTPGELRILRQDEISVWSSTKISPHQTGMNDLLAAAALQDALPERITVVGIQPVVLDDYGGSLSPKVKAQLDRAAQAGAEELTSWGVSLRKREADEPVPPLMDSKGIQMDVYEQLRPKISSAERTSQTRLKEGEF